MHNSTKHYIKRKVLQLIEQCDDKENIAGRVTIDDILEIVNEIKDEQTLKIHLSDEAIEILRIAFSNQHALNNIHTSYDEEEEEIYE